MSTHCNVSVRTPWNWLVRCGTIAAVMGGVVCGPACAGDKPPLEARVAALAGEGGAGRLRKAVLDLALERLGESRRAGDIAGADLLAGDIESALQSSAGQMARAESSAPHLSVLRAPLVVEKNPYLDRLVAGARSALAKPEAPWPLTRPDNVLIGPANAPGEYNPRDIADQMDAYLWLFANPASPLRHDPEVLVRFLRRAHAYTDAIIVHDQTRGGQSVYDDFAISPASCALREFARLYPGLLLPSQKKRWDRAMRMAGDKIMAYSAQHRAFHAKGYANIHMAMAFELLNFGLYLDDAAMLARSREFLESQQAAILPDGGVHYIGKQNESPGYHDVIAQFLARIHEISGDALALDLLKRLEWYGPVSIGRLGEYWTAPSWKHTWNSSMRGIAGGEYVAAVTGNPFVRGMLIPPSPATGNLRGWEDARPQLPWYRNDVTPLPLPDGVTYPDRNIDGPRGWYGRFSYAATLRDIPEDEPGHSTLMGALVTQPDSSLQVFVMGVYPRVRVGDKPEDPRSWAWLTSGLQSSRIVGRHFSVCYGSYEMATFGSSQKGRVADWRGRQLWLGLPDRIVGWLAVEPSKAGAVGREVQGIVRLGTGGTVNGPRQKAKEQGPGEWSYGDFVVRIVAHSFAGIQPKVVPFRQPDYPVTEFTLEGPSGQPGWFLVEIRPSWAPPATGVEFGKDPSGLLCLRAGVGEKRYWVVANPTHTGVALPPAPFKDGSSLHLSGWAEPFPWPAKAQVLEPGRSAVWIDRADKDDFLPGWISYPECIRSLTSPHSKSASPQSTPRP